MMMRMTKCFDHFFLLFCWFLFWEKITFILVLLNISNFATMGFYILCLPLSCWDIKGEYFITVVFLYFVYPLSFWNKKGEYFYFWIGNVFLNRSSDFVLEWPKVELISFVGCILLTKSLLCNVAVLIGTLYISESSKYSEFISLIRKRPYYDKFQCHKLQECYFSVPGRFCVDSNLEEVGFFVSIQTAQWCIRMPISVEKLLNSSSVHLSRRHGNTSRRYSEFEKIPVILCKHGLGRQLASIWTLGQHRPDSVLDKEIMCRQFEIVWTLEQHRPDAPLIWRVWSVLWKGGCSYPSGHTQLSSGRGLEKFISD
jgi:hypothetical protein